MKANTLDTDILVACDKETHRSGKATVGVPKIGTSILKEIQEALAESWAPATWHVQSDTLDNIVAGKASAPITVIDLVRQKRRQVNELAQSLANRQRENPSLSYVFIFQNLLHHKEMSQRIHWLSLFPDPEKVAIANDVNETLWAVGDMAMKLAVHRERLIAAPVKVPRASPLDNVKSVVEVTKDLREGSGNLSARLVADLFGISQRELALWLDRSPQAVTKTPDSDALQDALGYFERIARIRLVLDDNDNFRKWLRMANPGLNGRTPLDYLKAKKWQEIADFVNDILTGVPG